MCGIAGKVTADGAPVDPAMLGRMCAALRHRGPDAQGISGAVGHPVTRIGPAVQEDSFRRDRATPGLDEAGERVAARESVEIEDSEVEIERLQ